MAGMKKSDADYHSFILRIWNEDRAPTARADLDCNPADTGSVDTGGRLMQVEDIASGKKHYFNDLRRLTGYLDRKLGPGVKRIGTG